MYSALLFVADSCLSRQVVAELEQRSKQVAYDAAALTSQRQQLVALDAQRRAALRAIEDSLASAGARLDDRAKEEKLRQIRLAEEAYQVCSVEARHKDSHVSGWVMRGDRLPARHVGLPARTCVLHLVLVSI